MSSPGPIEEELKIPVDDLEAVRTCAKARGASIQVPRQLEDNAVLDTPTLSLLGSGRLLRLRRWGDEVLLTFKGPASYDRHVKSRLELETHVADRERMLGILRGAAEVDEVLSPQPGLSQVESLAARVSQAGLPVEVTVEGAPVALPPSVDLSAYRIIQEALTNALKHAGPAHATVKISHFPDSLELEITDDGQGASGEGAGDYQGGRGLIGMRERVALFGGELSVGPRSGGGFRVHVRLPLGGGPE